MPSNLLSKLANAALELTRAVQDERSAASSTLEILDHAKEVNEVIELAQKSTSEKLANGVVDMPFRLLGIDVGKKLTHFWRGMAMGGASMLFVTIGGVTYIFDRKEGKTIIKAAIEIGARGSDEFYESNLFKKDD